MVFQLVNEEDITYTHPCIHLLARKLTKRKEGLTI